MKITHQLRYFWLCVESLRALTSKAVDGSPVFKAGPKLRAKLDKYLDSFNDQLQTLASDIESQRDTLLKILGDDMPDEWLTFPVRLACIKIDQETGKLTPESEVLEEWGSVSEAILVKDRRLGCYTGSNGESVGSGIATYHGGGRYQLGETYISLDGSQANVLEALVVMRTATLSQLTKRSGVSNPSAILTTIRERHPLLAPHIFMPCGKGKGGYRTTIRPVEK